MVVVDEVVDAVVDEGGPGEAAAPDEAGVPRCQRASERAMATPGAGGGSAPLAATAPNPGNAAPSTGKSCSGASCGTNACATPACGVGGTGPAPPAPPPGANSNDCSCPDEPAAAATMPPDAPAAGGQPNMQ